MLNKAEKVRVSIYLGGFMMLMVCYILIPIFAVVYDNPTMLVLWLLSFWVLSSATIYAIGLKGE